MNPKTNTMDRSSAPAIMNPYDVYAVEEAVRIKEKYGGTISVLSMGPPPAVSTLKKCVEMGADDTYLISDRRFAGADTLATSYALAEALKKISSEKGEIDLVITGKQTIDGDTGQVGPGIARRLDIPPLTFVQKIKEIDLGNRKISVHRKREDGYEVVESELPCLLAVESGINEPRYAPLPNMIKAARHEPVVWSVDDLEDIDITKLGLKGSPTIVGKVWAPPKSEGAEMIEGSTDEVVARIVDLVMERKELFQDKEVQPS
ncbi:MAG: electron transfer flavoprotein subunit beta/FixA family protein [Bacillaceae bacterium]|nr:electron transfer flavoprotein subunit beta/FixA family protein [Bacillaceae bacterium]